MKPRIEFTHRTMRIAGMSLEIPVWRVTFGYNVSIQFGTFARACQFAGSIQR